MNYLIESNEFNIEDYFNFLKKYKNTRYISKNSENILRNLGIPFNNIVENVNRCFNFFELQDYDLLKDLLLYAKDECPVKVDIIYIYPSIMVKKKYRLDLFSVVVNVDEYGLPSKKIYKLDDQLNIVDLIIDKVECLKSDHVDKNSIKNFYRSLKINPSITIQANFSFSDQLSYFDRSNILGKFITYLRGEIMDRYFRTIGLYTSSNTDFFEITESFYGNNCYIEILYKNE